ncbi:hypothetical protein LOTGIDRAFT_236121, partial [Lottia gigantea]
MEEYEEVKSYKKKSKFTRKNRETKLLLVFDEKRRREYLTGFRRRKKERQNYYKEKLENKIRNERHEFKKETKEFLSKAHLEPDTKPEVEELIEPTVVDLPEHTVTITDIAEIDFSGGCGLRLGKNSTNDDADDWLCNNKLQGQDVKELTKHKTAMKKRMEHIKILEEKHKMITNKIECKVKNKKKRGHKSKSKNKKKGKKK